MLLLMYNKKSKISYILSNAIVTYLGIGITLYLVHILENFGYNLNFI